MTREQSPNFSQKHGAHAGIDPIVKQKIADNALDGRIACAMAFQIAKELNIPPSEIGKGADLLNIRLIKCQLGLFGYEPEKKVVKPKSADNEELIKAIREALVENRLACRAAWNIARRFNRPKMSVSATCEALNIKIKPCQLGAF